MSAPARTVPSMPADVPLSDLERQVLTFAGERWNYRGAKDEAVRVRLGISPTRYSQILLALAGRPAALVEFPQLVHRLRRRAG